MQVLLARPRGFCAGVTRAIAIVERAIEVFGAPIYVRHEIVHNRTVVQKLRDQGAVFVDEVSEVPDGATLVFSAHGVSKAVQREAQGRSLRIFDATCPLVTKVHREVVRMRDAGKGGCILNVTSNAAFIVNKTQAMSPYSSAKAAANHFTHCMAVELGKYNIRCNAIAPGFTNSELSRHIPKDQFAYINNQMPLGRFGEPIEVGALAVYLASPAAAQITGTVQVIDGGYILSC